MAKGKMKLAIVGTSKELDTIEYRNASDIIATHIERLKPDEVISGGATGIDDLAAMLAMKMGYPIQIKRPTSYETRDFMRRNLEIAKECDMLLCISTKVKTQKCYHHVVLQNHEKTAGCWTLREANFLGKPTKLVIV